MRTDILENDIRNLLHSCPELQDDEQLRSDMLEGETDLKRVLTILVEEQALAKCNSKAVKEHISELSDRGARYALKSERIRGLIERILSTADLRKLELVNATLSIGNKPQQAIVEDLQRLPKEYTKITVSPDKTKIKEALKNNVPVPGACLSNGGQSLTIRVK